MSIESENGKCRDCGQGILTPALEGFEFYEDGGFWFCCYCGSNHVEVTTAAGEPIKQGDLYPETGLYQEGNNCEN